MQPKYKFQYYFILALFRVLSLLPMKLLYLISEIFTLLIYGVLGYRKKVVFENLRNSFSERSEEEIAFTAKKFYRHFSCLIVENICLRFVSKKQFEKRYILENRALFQNLYNQGKSIVNMTAHIGNWEYGSGVVGTLPHKGAAVYKKLSNPAFDKLFYDIRNRLGNEPVEMNDVLRRVIELNKEETPFILSMVTDQAPAFSKANHWIPFLNQETNVFLGSEKIARKFKTAVVYTEIVRHKKGIYRLTPKLITEDASLTKEFEVTETYFQLLEESIKKHPRYWLWSHRRWKHKRITQA
ncbi:MAG: lysophospholipid acyltransferase family protein [Salinivirgaceae bacterium]|jgi:KDO2-lipid IV(A) lauroyltransferase|nr:lysophospholipid acyltransferase family protein [Salinivirgaceae bacterium]